ncbi:hypothetical protein LXM94_12770 [Rhizobium sp. TRM95111]|uniref:NepR family anti-sigma factor n=1 Tax=Rhizobium alarense TaxID=2846851 RepID=UPI001F24D86C|nr:NepR family anti-sigma factor [Rhizobium alarense]MCF3640842.1 hypothetical protein [Rhizobium alarense]
MSSSTNRRRWALGREEDELHGRERIEMKSPAGKGAMQSAKGKPRVAADPAGVIGRKLRSFYDSVETEPVPDHLLDLLEQLDEAERRANAPR